MTDLRTKIICAVPVDGKSKKGRMLAKALTEIWQYDTCTRILIERSGVEAFVGQLSTLIPKDNCAYCNESYYETEWRRAIWKAAWEAYQAYKQRINDETQGRKA